MNISKLDRNKRIKAVRDYFGGGECLMLTNYIELLRIIDRWNESTIEPLKAMALITTESKIQDVLNIATTNKHKLRYLFADNMEKRGMTRRQSGHIFSKMVDEYDYENIDKSGLYRLISHALVFNYEKGLDVDDNAIMKKFDDYYKGVATDKARLQKEIADKVNKFFGGRAVTAHALSVFFRVKYGIVECVDGSQTLTNYRHLTV